MNCSYAQLGRISPERQRLEAWLRDQYQHPEEHRHTIAEVQRSFAENHVEYFRTYPSAILGDEPDDLFVRAADNWGLENGLAQVTWMRVPHQTPAAGRQVSAP